MSNIKKIEKYLGIEIKDNYEIISKGRDFEVILYDNYIYRFPRLDKIMDLQLEKRKLDTIQPYITLQIPQFTIVDNSFIIYPVLKGKTFDECACPFSDDNISSLANFLKELHSVPLDKFYFINESKGQSDNEKKGFEVWVQSMKDDVGKRLNNKLKTENIEKILSYMDELFFVYESPVKAFVHGDLQGKNIIFDPNTNKITGIIDFTDSRVGGIEIDFSHFAFRDDKVLEKLLTYYMGGVDKEFIKRIEFLAKRNVIWEITNDDVYNNNFEYIIELLNRYEFI